MIGNTTVEEKLRMKKLEDLKKGHYNDQIITLLPNVYRPKLDIQ